MNEHHVHIETIRGIVSKVEVEDVIPGDWTISIGGEVVAKVESISLRREVPPSGGFPQDHTPRRPS